jgi:hypothetical protein
VGSGREGGEDRRFEGTLFLRSRAMIVHVNSYTLRPLLLHFDSGKEEDFIELGAFNFRWIDSSIGGLDLAPKRSICRAKRGGNS